MTNNYDTSLYIQTDKNVWANTFYFQMVENNIEPKFKYNNIDILSVNDGYNNSESSYSSNKIVDVNSNTMKTILRELAKYVFGSPHSVGLFTNIPSLKISIESALENSAVNINSKIDDNGGTYSIVTNESNTGYILAKEIYNNINNNTERLKIHYTVESTGSTLPTSSIISNFTDSTNGGIVSVTTDSSSCIIEIEIISTGSNYTKGDSITFTNSNYTIYYSSITSYQASAMNGTLYTDDIEIPFETNDNINVISIIKSSPEQMDGSNDPTEIDISVKYTVKLI